MDKNGYLHSYEICEYADRCKDDCNGKNPLREGNFSCGLRRGLLISDGYNVLYCQ